MTSSPAGVRPGPSPISRVAVRRAASRSARRTAPRSAASGPPGPVGQAGQGEGAVRHALAVERVAQLADALGEERRPQAGQLGPRVPPRGRADREVAHDDPAAPDLGRSAAGQRYQGTPVAGAEEHAAQREPGGVTGEDPDDVAAAVVGHVQVDGRRDAHEHAGRADGPAEEFGHAGAGRGRYGGRGTGGPCGPRRGLRGGAGQGDRGDSGLRGTAARRRVRLQAAARAIGVIDRAHGGPSAEGRREAPTPRPVPLHATRCGGGSVALRGERRPTIQRAGWTGVRTYAARRTPSYGGSRQEWGSSSGDT